MSEVVVAMGVQPAGMPAGTPSVPNAPPIRGLRFRGIVLPDDLAALAELGNAAQAFDQVPEHVTAEELGNWFTHDDKRDPARDILLAEVDGRLVGNAIAGWELDSDGSHNYGTWGVVHPEWRRQGLGTALHRWVEARQRQLAATHRPDVVKRLESWSFVQEAGRNALLEHHGFTPIRYWFEMERADLETIPDVPLPEGFAFRDPLTANPRAVWDVVVSAFQDHFGGMDDSEAGFQQHLHDPNRDPSLWVLVENEGRIVGTALNKIKRAQNEALGGVSRGRVNAVAVLRDFRGRGLGRAITAQSLRVLRNAGMTSASLGVDAENPHGALGIYESLGFAVVERGRIYRKQLGL